jgi:hypothetical protein
MENIAPAVMNGGFSSILALSLLATSRSHIFVSFFKGRTRLLPFMIEINQRSEFLRRI